MSILHDLKPEEFYLRGEEVRYELQRFGADFYFDRQTLEQIRVDIRRRHEIQEDMAVSVMGVVATWRKERMLQVPANWWQHFKQRFFPRWALKRWPVLYEHYDAAVILPKVPVRDARYHTAEFPVWQRSEEKATPVVRHP